MGWPVQNVERKRLSHTVPETINRDGYGLKKKVCQPRILCPGKPFFKNGEIKILLNEQERGNLLLADLPSSEY